MFVGSIDAHRLNTDPTSPKVLLEAHRVLREDGIFLLMDTSQGAVRSMPKWVYTLFSSTEPDMDDYMALGEG
jgi:ubiquinone/menaquinone biosynthesis C-methylase UbiE